jgi:hypothetical protein
VGEGVRVVSGGVGVGVVWEEAPLLKGLGLGVRVVVVVGEVDGQEVGGCPVGVEVRMGKGLREGVGEGAEREEGEKLHKGEELPSPPSLLLGVDDAQGVGGTGVLLPPITLGLNSAEIEERGEEEGSCTPVTEGKMVGVEDAQGVGGMGV